MSDSEHLRAQRMIIRNMVRVSALPCKMTFPAHKRYGPASEEAVPVGPMMAVYPRRIANDTAALITDVYLTAKLLPGLGV